MKRLINFLIHDYRFAIVLCAVIFMALPAEADPYDATFWMWVVDNGSADISDAASMGFDGITTVPAYSNGSEMDYYFDSPTLAGQGWTNHKWNKVESYASDAHSRGLKVMVDLEAVNPYHWEEGQYRYDTDILKGMVDDLHDAGVDRWFDECFDMWSDWALAIADEADSLGMECQSGNDPMHINQVAWVQHQTPTDFPTLYSHNSPIGMYFYKLDRDAYLDTAALGQHGALAFGFADTWKKTKTMVYGMYANWGINPNYWPGVMRACMMIEALQFRVDDFVFVGSEDYSISSDMNLPALESWINGMVQVQDASGKKPVLNIVVHLKIPEDDQNWVSLSSQADAITWSAFQAGYNVKCSTSPLPDADAYYIVTRGNQWEGGTYDLTGKIADLFSTDKPVILQCLYGMPYDESLTDNWRIALGKIGICANIGGVSYEDIPSSGTFDGMSFRMTGYDTREMWWHTELGTRMSAANVAATNVIADSDGLPLVVGQNRKYFVSGAFISWQVSSILSRCLSGYGTAPDSDVWGVAGPAVTALIATNSTDLKINIPGLGDGSSIHVVEYDRYYNKTYDQTVTYTAPFERSLSQYDFVLIDTVSLVNPASEPEIPGSDDPGVALCPGMEPKRGLFRCSQGSSLSALLSVMLIGGSFFRRRRYSIPG